MFIVSADQATVTRMALEEGGYLAGAFAMIDDPDHIDMSVTELNIEHPDGISVAMRARARDSDVPVLFVTGRADLLKTSCTAAI